MGGTAYLVRSKHGNILVDCPAWNDTTLALLEQHGGIRWLVLTHRGGMGTVSQMKQIQSQYGCELLVQEQEAYLLPQIEVTSFQRSWSLSPEASMIWTPGHSPGSACLYYQSEGGVLFTGRHLLPNVQGQLLPLRVAKTFHWFRQLRSVQLLLDEFTEETLHIGCPGANTGFLRKQRCVHDLYQQLRSIDLTHCKTLQPQ